MAENRNNLPGLLGEAPAQEGQGEYRSIYIHFECREDMEEFRRVTGLDINPDTRAIWYPDGCVRR